MEIAINSNEIIAKYIQLDPSQKDNNYFSFHSWYFRFIKRYGFSIRERTHIGQKLKENAQQQWEEFSKFYIGWEKK